MKKIEEHREEILTNEVVGDWQQLNLYEKLDVTIEAIRRAIEEIQEEVKTNNQTKNELKSNQGVDGSVYQGNR